MGAAVTVYHAIGRRTHVQDSYAHCRLSSTLKLLWPGFSKTCPIFFARRFSKVRLAWPLISLTSQERSDGLNRISPTDELFVACLVAAFYRARFFTSLPLASIRPASHKATAKAAALTPDRRPCRQIERHESARAAHRARLFNRGRRFITA